MSKRQPHKQSGPSIGSTSIINRNRKPRPTFAGSQKTESMVDITPEGFYAECPHCQRELRINRKYLETEVQCKFCRGAFLYEMSNRLINTRAFYAECPHCSQELRIAKKYSGMTVSCKHCRGKVHLRQGQNRTIFQVERDGAILIVRPQGDAMRFRYVDVHLEANALKQESLAPDVDNLLIDLGDVAVMGSIMIDALVKLARNASNGGKQAAFCKASKELREALESMKLDAVWPIYDSRASALDALA